jgi:hypothetical protein
MSRRAAAAPTALLLLLAALPAAATSTRVLSMGGGGDYFEDVDNVRRWPGTLATYPDLLLLELGEQDGSKVVGQGLCAHLSLDGAGRYGVAGLWLYDDAPEQDVRLMWSLKRENWQLGLQCAYGDHTLANQSFDSWFQSHRWNLGAGLRWELAPRTWIDLACEGTDTHDTVAIDYDPVVADDRGMDSFGLRWRLFHGLGENLALVPCVAWERALNHERVSTDWFGRRLWGDYDAFQGAGVHYLSDTSSFGGGLGLVLLPDPDRMLQASLNWSRVEYELSDPAEGALAVMLGQDATSTVLTMRLGGEARVLHWLTVRGGAWKTLSVSDVTSLWSTKSTGSKWYKNVRTDELDVSLGIGLHLGDFLADLVVADDAPFRAGGLLNGTSGGNPLWTRITLQVVF